MKKGCRICPTAIFWGDFQKEGKAKERRTRTEDLTGNGDEVEEEDVSREEEREPECEITARVSVVNAS